MKRKWIAGLSLLLALVLCEGGSSAATENGEELLRAGSSRGRGFQWAQYMHTAFTMDWQSLWSAEGQNAAEQGMREEKVMEENAKYSREMAKYLDYDYELVKVASDEEITGAYLELLEQGKKEGFIPLMLMNEEVLLREMKNYMFRPQAEVLAGRDIFYEEMSAINVEEMLERWKEEDLAWLDEAQLSPEEKEKYLALVNAEKQEYESEPYYDQWGRATLFNTGATFNDQGEEEEIIFAKIPAKEPWEIPFWIGEDYYVHWPQEETAALFKRWHEKYGAYPAAFSYDTWVIYLEAPPQTEAACKELARDLYAFNGEELIYDFAPEAIDDMTAENIQALKENRFYGFWWD